jgi:hypothetical protein
MDRIKQGSPRHKAKITGMFYLLTVLTGIFAQGFVSERLVVSGDAGKTATNILAHESLFLFGFTVYMIEMACQIIFIALFYELLKPVSGTVSLVAAFAWSRWLHDQELQPCVLSCSDIHSGKRRRLERI